MSDDPVRIRVTGRQFRHNGEEYLHGDELTVPRRAIEGWDGRVEVIETAESDGESEPEADPADGSEDDAAGQADDEGGPDEDESDEVVVDPHPSDLTNDELESRLADVDDLDLLRAIRAEETAGKDRTGAKDAIDARIEELEG